MAEALVEREIGRFETEIREIENSITLVDKRIEKFEEDFQTKIKELERKLEEYEKRFALYQRLGISDKVEVYEVIGAAVRKLISERGSNFTISIVRDGKLSPEIRAVITPADLGNLIEPQFISEVYTVIGKFGVARKLFDVIPVVSNSIKATSADGYVQVYWRSKQTPAQTRETALPAFTSINVNLEWLDAFLVLSKDAIRFTNYALGNYIVEKLAEGFARYEDYVAFQGVQANDIFNGLVNVAGNTYTLGTGKTSYTQVTADDFRKAIEVLPLKHRENAAFLMHPTVFSVVELLKDSTNNYIYRKPSDKSEPGTLWGYPVYLSEGMPSTDGAGRAFAVFGNFKNSKLYYYQDLSFDITDQATVTLPDSSTVNLWQRDALAIRGSEMIAFAHPLPSAYVVMKTAAL